MPPGRWREPVPDRGPQGEVTARGMPGEHERSGRETSLPGSRGHKGRQSVYSRGDVVQGSRPVPAGLSDAAELRRAHHVAGGG